jgi:hypothetical protein
MTVVVFIVSRGVDRTKVRTLPSVLLATVASLGECLAALHIALLDCLTALNCLVTLITLL